MSALAKFEARARAVRSLVCVGLDSDIRRLPDRFRALDQPQLAFNRWILEQTAPFVSACKLNVAFYEARGEAGLRELRATVEHLKREHPDILTVCDAKRADIGDTSRAYAEAVFDEFGFDAVTLNPYLGRDALEPFLERADRASIILCRTSNAGARELQDLDCAGKPLWQIVAERVAESWNARGNCMLVVGATYPAELGRIRAITGDMTFLVPGVGAQGASAATVVSLGLNRRGLGLMINSSRAIMQADSPAEAAKALRDEIEQARRAAGRA